MSKTMITIITCLAVLNTTGGTLLAQENGDNSRDHERRWEGKHGAGRDLGSHEGMSERMAEHLGLDESQAQAVKNIMEAAKPEFEALRQRARENRQAMRALDVNSADYGVSLQNLSTESGQLTTETSLLRGKVRSDINAVLTPEQQQKLAERPDRKSGHRWRGAR